MFFFTVIFTMILAGAEVDLFVPSFPQLQNIFNISPFMVELTLGVNLFFHCITALIVGSLGDKYGRKSITIIGLIIFNFGSLLCVLTDNYSILLIGRIFQGIGISGPAVLLLVIISDLYEAKKMQYLMGIINASVAIAMASAPVVGSYVNLFFNWRGNFVVLLIMGVISLVLSVFFIPRTKELILRPNIKISLSDYKEVFKSKKANLYLISICFAMQCYWVFIGMSPILYMEDLGVPLKDFGLYQGIIAAFFAVTSLSSSYFIKRFGAKRCFFVSCYLIAIFFLMVLWITIFNIKDPFLITLAMLFQAVGMAYPVNIFYPLALESIKNAKSRIGALLVSFRILMSAIIIGLASYFYDGSFFTIGISICTTLGISGITCYLLFKCYRILE